MTLQGTDHKKHVPQYGMDHDTKVTCRPPRIYTFEVLAGHVITTILDMTSLFCTLFLHCY